MKPDIQNYKAIPTKRVPAKWANVHRFRVDKHVAKPSLEAITQYVNGIIAYKLEVSDNWQTPGYTLEVRTGDCEDFCILKRALLLNAGFKDEDIFLVLVYDRIARRDHAILGVSTPEGLMFLDTNNLVVPADKLVDYVPKFAFTGSKSWVYGS